MPDRVIHVAFTSFRDSESNTHSSHTLRELHKGNVSSLTAVYDSNVGILTRVPSPSNLSSPSLLLPY